MLTNVLQRRRRSLDGPWHVIVDPYEMGYIGILGDRNDRGFFRDHKPRHSADRVEYDFDRSPTLMVPGDWNTQDERLFFYEGTVWYRRRITVAPDEWRGARQFLHIGAANHTSRIFVDGDELAIHSGGFGPYAIELTGRLDPGEHSIVIQVDNRREPDRIPAMRSDWWNFGGLTRSVDIVDVPETFLRDAWLTMDPSGRVIGGVTIDGDSGEPVRLELPGLGASTIVDGAFELDIDPERWHPGKPVLHDVMWSVGDDEVTDSVGFRTVEVDGTDIVVNGKPTFLRGISIHEEAPLDGGRAFGVEHARTLLGWAKELGCNFVRLAHYPHHEAMVRLADEMGLLVWSEIPVYWTILWDRPETYAAAERQLTEMITRDRNRASVILWSVANETPVGDARLRFLTRLIERARALDETRLVTAATELTRDGTALVLADPLIAHLDVVGANEYVGWYGGAPEDALTLTWRSDYDKPLIVSEFGGGARYGLHGDPGTRWTEEYQEALYVSQIAMLRKVPFLRGMSPWILADFRSPRRLLPGIQDYWNRKGLISDRGQRKKAFFVLRDFYRELAGR